VDTGEVDTDRQLMSCTSRALEHFCDRDFKDPFRLKVPSESKLPQSEETVNADCCLQQVFPHGASFDIGSSSFCQWTLSVWQCQHDCMQRSWHCS
jgi:hypothetical protein